MAQNGVEQRVARCLEVSLDHIAKARDEIRARTQMHIDRYWANHFDGNRNLKPWQGSTLGVRAKKGSGNDFYIQWFWNRWFKDKAGKVQTRSTYIRKGNGFAYAPQTLEKFAKEWELDLVLHLESEFAEIREQLRDLKRGEMALRRAHQKLGVDQHTDEGAEPSRSTANALVE